MTTTQKHAESRVAATERYCVEDKTAGDHRPPDFPASCRRPIGQPRRTRAACHTLVYNCVKPHGSETTGRRITSAPPIMRCESFVITDHAPTCHGCSAAAARNPSWKHRIARRGADAPCSSSPGNASAPDPDLSWLVRRHGEQRHFVVNLQPHRNL